MSTRAQHCTAEVLRADRLATNLIRIVLGSGTLAAFESTMIADEWIGLVVPGQFQSRYYTVRRWDGDQLTLDVVVHEQGLVTQWAAGDPVGDLVTITEPKGSFSPAPTAQWLMLVGDLTALPAMARIAESTALPTRVWVESPDRIADYFVERDGLEVTWMRPPARGGSALAELVAGLDWPEQPGYFWMAGESAQMRAIRKHLMRERQLGSHEYDVMGYWRGVAKRQPRAIDPGPIYAAGKAAGKSDAEIWDDYDQARERADESE